MVYGDCDPKTGSVVHVKEECDTSVTVTADCLIEPAKWGNFEAQDVDVLPQPMEEKIQLAEPGPMGLPFIDYLNSSNAHNEEPESSVSEMIGTSSSASSSRSLMVDLFDIPEFDANTGGDSEEYSIRETRQILKRRRSLNDDMSRRVKREKQLKLHERRRSVDSCVKLRTTQFDEGDNQVQSRLTKRSNLWTYEEEVFLVAAVMECFLRRGSLTSNKGRDGCWNEIKSFFDTFLTNYLKTKNRVPVNGRATSALYRHFKTLKERIAKNPHKNLKEYYHRFQFEYNKNNRLMSGTTASIDSSESNGSTGSTSSN